MLKNQQHKYQSELPNVFSNHQIDLDNFVPEILTSGNSVAITSPIISPTLSDSSSGRFSSGKVSQSNDRNVEFYSRQNQLNEFPDHMFGDENFFNLNDLQLALQHERHNQHNQQSLTSFSSSISPPATSPSSMTFSSATPGSTNYHNNNNINNNLTSSSSSSVISTNHHHQRLTSISPPNSSHSSTTSGKNFTSQLTIGSNNQQYRQNSSTSSSRLAALDHHHQSASILHHQISSNNNFEFGPIKSVGDKNDSLYGISEFNNNSYLYHHQSLKRSFSSTNTSSSMAASPPTNYFLKHNQQQQFGGSTGGGGDEYGSVLSLPTSSHHYHHHHHLNQYQQQQFQSQNSITSNNNNNKCWCLGGDATYHFKTLVPAVASGAIIGKGGETIASLQRDTGARVKMSKSHDFYPGTSERVCLITGSVEAIMTVLDFIMEKIREKPDLTTKLTDIEAKQAQERDKQVKILVPNSTAGMIIGKAGAYIKQIKEESGSYVQISQKPKDITLQERCITIIGERENNKVACKMILSKIVEDPQSGACPNVSYADVNGPVANYNPTGSPYATNQNAISSSTASLNSALGTTVGGAGAAGLLVNGTALNLSLNLGAPQTTNPTLASQLLDHIKASMRGAGFSETVTSEVCAALGVLAKYGVLGVGVGLPHTNGAHSAPVSYLGVSALEQSAAAATAAAAGGVFGALGQVNLEQYIGQQSATPRATLEAAAAAAQFDPFRHAGAQAATPISLNNNSFGLAANNTANAAATAQALNAAHHSIGALSKSPTPGDLGAKDTKNVEIPEVIVGAILGPSGRSLVEIQHASGANIQISKKGIFAPGTRNRIVTISGQPGAIAMAHFLIETKINEEETKRARQNTITTSVIQ